MKSPKSLLEASGSDPDYTLDCEEPFNRSQHLTISGHRSIVFTLDFRAVRTLANLIGRDLE